MTEKRKWEVTYDIEWWHRRNRRSARRWYVTEAESKDEATGNFWRAHRRGAMRTVVKVEEKASRSDSAIPGVG